MLKHPILDTQGLRIKKKYGKRQNESAVLLVADCEHVMYKNHRHIRGLKGLVGEGLGAKGEGLGARG